MKIPNYSKTVLRTCAALALFWTLGATAAPASAFDVAGVKYRLQSQSSGVSLVLNGAGVRKLGAADMYAAGLYLEKRQSSSAAVLGSTGTKQLRVVLLRDVNGRQMGDLLSRGLASNASEDELELLIPEIVNLGKLIAEQGKLRAGDSFQIDWHPAVGTTISIFEKGQRPMVHSFGAPDLVKVMMRVWLGERPADPELKSALLGRSS